MERSFKALRCRKIIESEINYNKKERKIVLSFFVKKTMRLFIFTVTLLITISKLITANNCINSRLFGITGVTFTADSCSSKESVVQAVAKDSLHHGRLSKKEKREKLITAIAAFPLPFGFVGAHRVILGTKPWIPVVYVATFGGCFGILPMIDFLVILFDSDIEKFENDPNVFMWTK